jgi:transposase
MKKITLNEHEIKYLHTFVSKGSKKARALTRARILLLSNDGKKEVEIQKVLTVGRSTIWRVRNNYISKGVEFALTERDRPGQPVIYDTRKKAEIIAFACTTPPVGCKRWSVRLLAEELSKQKNFKSINRETIRLVLKKATPNLG